MLSWLAGLFGTTPLELECWIYLFIIVGGGIAGAAVILGAIFPREKKY